MSVYQVWTDSDYVFVATTSGLDIYDVNDDSDRYAYITYSGFNTVWANDDKVFTGTTNSGVKYIDKTCISGSVGNPYDLVTCLNDFSDLTYYHELTSDNIRYIHGSGDVLCMITDSGVDVVKLDPQSYRSYSLVNNVKKCFMTADKKFYYTISGTEWSLNRVDSCLGDWTIPDKSYVTDGGIFEAGIELNDMFITEETASDGINNTIFCATSSGVYIICEFTDSYNIYYNDVLQSDTNNFVAVWADNTTTSGSGKMYVASEGYFNVVNLSDQTIYDWYSTVHLGKAGVVLSGSNVVDINITK